ncbi:unnamed protein product, partial [Ixodes pacificus]
MSADGSTQVESTEEAVLRKHLKDLQHVQHQWIGYVHTDVELQTFERDLARINVSFQTERSFYKSNIDTECEYHWRIIYLVSAFNRLCASVYLCARQLAAACGLLRLECGGCNFT